LDIKHKLMKIYIDQSNKIEQTQKDTILGLCNGKEFAIIIPRKIKREIQKLFRTNKKPALFVYRTFIAGVVLLLHYAKLNLSQSDSIVIDIEYFGKNKLLKSMFLEMYSRYFDRIPHLYFQKIGKKSGAHKISYLTSTKKRKADKLLVLQEVRKLTIR